LFSDILSNVKSIIKIDNGFCGYDSSVDSPVSSVFFNKFFSYLDELNTYEYEILVEWYRQRKSKYSDRSVLVPILVPFPVISTLRIQPLKMEQIDGSETSAFKNQTPGIHPKDYSQQEKS
jgi:hypothetical protein